MIDSRLDSIGRSKQFKDRVFDYFYIKKEEFQTLYDIDISLNIKAHRLSVHSECSHYIDFNAIVELINSLWVDVKFKVDVLYISKFSLKDFYDDDLKKIDNVKLCLGKSNSLINY